MNVDATRQRASRCKPASLGEKVRPLTSSSSEQWLASPALAVRGWSSRAAGTQQVPMGKLLPRKRTQSHEMLEMQGLCALFPAPHRTSRETSRMPDWVPGQSHTDQLSLEASVSLVLKVLPLALAHLALDCSVNLKPTHHNAQRL